MRNGQLFQQVIWEPVTAESAFGLLPTPRTCSAMASRLDTAGNLEGERFPNLETVIGKMLPTPTTRDYKDSGPNVNYQKAAEKGRLPGAIVVQCSVHNGGATYLAPCFVEEMMGYEIGWTDLNN